MALLDYPDGHLAEVPATELAAHVTGLADRYRPGGLLVFDDTGITGHPDHRAATQAAIGAAQPLGLPVLAWALPAGIAARLRAETGQPFRRPATPAAGLRHPGQPGPAAPGCPAAYQPGLAGSAAMAAAGATRKYRAPALARAIVRRSLS